MTKKHYSAPDDKMGWGIGSRQVLLGQRFPSTLRRMLEARPRLLLSMTVLGNLPSIVVKFVPWHRAKFQYRAQAVPVYRYPYR